MFNEGNLASLYEILSKGCLDEEDRLKEGEIYRYDEVEADQYLDAHILKSGNAWIRCLHL